MMKYLSLEKFELKFLILNSIIFSLMFSITYTGLMVEKNLFFTFSLFLTFIFFISFLRLIFMKYYAYKIGVELKINETYFDRYFFRNWDKISYHLGHVFPKGFHMYFVSIIFYFITLGFFIFPETYKYSYKKIPHLYLGTQHRYEGNPGNPRHQVVSKYRYSKIIFVGVLFYFIIAFVLKLFSNIFNFDFYNPTTFILYYYAIFSTLPIPLTQGYDLYSNNRSAWIAGISILIFSLFILLIFKSIFLITLFTIISVIVIIITILWKMLMK